MLYARLWKQVGLSGNNDNIRLKVRSAGMTIDEAFWNSKQGTGGERKGFMEKRSLESFKLDLIG